MSAKKLLLISFMLSVCIAIFTLGNVHATSAQSKKVCGNTSGNISNFGYYAVQGNWIYYSNFDDNGKLYKMKLDSTEGQKLSNDNAEFINVVGEWVYYINYNNNKSYINKIKVDGSNETSMLEDNNNIKFLNVCDNKIYYIIGNNQADINSWYYTINELKADGTKIGEVFRFPICSSPSYFNVLGNYGYCLVNKYDGNEPSNIIYKFNLDGSNKFAKLVNNAITFNVSEDWIYYGTFNEIRKVKTDGKEDQKIAEGFPGGLPDGQWGDPTCLNVEGNWIYYKDWKDQTIYKIDTNGKNKVKLLECTAQSINIAGEYLYCPEYGLNSIEDFYKYIGIRKIKK